VWPPWREGMTLAVFRAATQGRPYKDILADFDDSPGGGHRGGIDSRGRAVPYWLVRTH